ncbi:MAG: flavodoxin domain-containing protein [Thermoproteota archaeon]
MPRVLVLYYSISGNTEKMARAVIEGLRAGGVEVDVRYYVDAEELMAYDATVIGTPTYNRELPLEIKRILNEATSKNVNLSGRVGAVFGSYGWSGEAPDKVLEIMESGLGMHVLKPPLKIKGSPDQYGLEKCRDLGRRVVEELRTRTAKEKNNAGNQDNPVAF